MQKIVTLSIITVFVLGSAAYAAGDDTTAAARGQQVLAQTRAALGGEAKLKAVQSLSATGSFRQVVRGATPQGNMEVEGEVQLDFLAPDKFKRVHTTEVLNPPAQIPRIQGSH